MYAEYKERIAVRLSIKQRQKIEQLVRERKFKNISDAIREALQHFLSKEVEQIATD